MIFAKRRKSKQAAGRAGTPPTVWIGSKDLEFTAKMEGLLRQWGYTVHHQDLLLEAKEGGGDRDVVLLDIREMGAEVFRVASAIKLSCPGVEMVLINRPDNVAASIAGMRAGAGDELILPFDTKALQQTVSEACKRKRATWYTSVVKPLLSRFSESMMAATFAQAGDFDGALDLLDGHQLRKTEKPSAAKDRE